MDLRVPVDPEAHPVDPEAHPLDSEAHIVDPGDQIIAAGISCHNNPQDQFIHHMIITIRFPTYTIH
jgi:hypothetical protein